MDAKWRQTSTKDDISPPWRLKSAIAASSDSKAQQRELITSEFQGISKKGGLKNQLKSVMSNREATGFE